MRAVFLLLLYFVTVLGANKHTKSLTESMGQEVIEINGPLKELPPDLEEEPSAENEDDKSTSTTIQVATVKDVTKTVKPDNSLKDTEKIDGQKDDEEARIEKELADIYKDSLDYKGDSAEVIKDTTDTKSTGTSEKPVVRVRNNFKFQPDSNNPREVALFRTSVDDISCKKNKLSDSVTTLPTSGCRNVISKTGFYAIMTLICVYV